MRNRVQPVPHTEIMILAGSSAAVGMIFAALIMDHDGATSRFDACIARAERRDEAIAGPAPRTSLLRLTVPAPRSGDLP
jgi:hypothetical protein